MNQCKLCDEHIWKNHYMVAQQRFDKVVTRLTIGTIIAFTITVLCLIATICSLVKLEKFINEFEYVEETDIQIEQDCRGENAVIIDGSGVIGNGTEIHRDNKEILEKEEVNKTNCITVYK